MGNTTNRRLRILQLLPYENEGAITVTKIIERLKDYDIDAETRAVQRDLEDLSADFPIGCEYMKKPYAWYWTSEIAVSIPAMSPFTALTLQLAEMMLKPLLPAQCLGHLSPGFSTARKVLDEVDKKKARNWLKKIRVIPRSLRQISASIPDGLYDIVTQALYDDKQLEVTYTAASNQTGKPRTHIIHPYGLLHRGATTELIGKKEGKSDLMRLLLHRMHTAKILEVTSKRPVSFDLDSYIESETAKPLSGKEIVLKAWIRKEGYAFNHVLETRLSENQKIEYVKDGLIITATVRETIELQWWLLGLGERVKVLEPESLRDEIKRIVIEAAKLYQ